MAVKPGDRVVCVQSADGDAVRIYGEGEYVGKSVPGPEAAGMMADIMRHAGVSNPELKLDTGETVWGCECWFGPQSVIHGHISAMGPDATIRRVSIAEARDKYKKEQENYENNSGKESDG